LYCQGVSVFLINNSGILFFLDLLSFFDYHFESKMTIKAITSLILGWIIPGMGHFFLKKYWRAIIFFVCITLMFSLGLYMEGKVYSFQTENPLTILGFFSDLGIGLYYFLAKIFSFGLGNLKSTTFEFGTAYIAGAGLLNFLAALDALDIASGKKI
jgi:hypothetical protein